MQVQDSTGAVNWIPLTDHELLEKIREHSFIRPQLIFKHSTRCSISSLALSRMEKGPTSPLVDYYFLDLLRYRNLSDRVAETYAVPHESPQVLVIREGECRYEESHLQIDPQEIWQEVSS
ncbi:MAG: bacillithiol system redox-active protein YtxJ [Chitinophagaceae bacterium]